MKSAFLHSLDIAAVGAANCRSQSRTFSGARCRRPCAPYGRSGLVSVCLKADTRRVGRVAPAIYFGAKKKLVTDLPDCYSGLLRPVFQNLMAEVINYSADKVPSCVTIVVYAHILRLA